VNRDTLACQAADAFRKSPELQVDTLCGTSSTFTMKANVTVATIQTLTSRHFGGRGVTRRDDISEDQHQPDEDEAEEAALQGKSQSSLSMPPRASLVIIDECHCAHADTYLRLAAAYTTSSTAPKSSPGSVDCSPETMLLGLTATPFRLDPKEPLSAVFGSSVWGPSVSELVRRGVLVAPVVYGCIAPLAKSNTVGSSASEKEFSLVLKLWKRHCSTSRPHPDSASARGNDGTARLPMNRATIAFCASIKQSHAFVSFCNVRGESWLAVVRFDELPANLNIVEPQRN
jgi:superfamily II DNA or RNA helicase